MKELEEITISMEEYKELLIIKGRYEELKSNQPVIPLEWNKPTLTRTLYGSGEPLPENPIKITCSE